MRCEGRDGWMEELQHDAVGGRTQSGVSTGHSRSPLITVSRNEQAVDCVQCISKLSLTVAQLHYKPSRKPRSPSSQGRLCIAHRSVRARVLDQKCSIAVSSPTLSLYSCTVTNSRRPSRSSAFYRRLMVSTGTSGSSSKPGRCRSSAQFLLSRRVAALAPWDLRFHELMVRVYSPTMS